MTFRNSIPPPSSEYKSKSSKKPASTMQQVCYMVLYPRRYCHVIMVTIDWVWFANRIYWTCRNRNYITTTTSNNNVRGTSQSAIHYGTHYVLSVCCVFISSMVTASNGRHFSSYGFPSCIVLQTQQLFTNSPTLKQQLSELRVKVKVMLLSKVSRAPIWGSWPILFTVRQLRVCWFGVPSRREDGSIV
jgi:hypothetical protein